MMKLGNTKIASSNWKWASELEGCRNYLKGKSKGDCELTTIPFISTYCVCQFPPKTIAYCYECGVEGNPKNTGLADVTCNKTEFDPTIDYRKKPTLLGLRKRPQDIVALPSLP